MSRLMVTVTLSLSCPDLTLPRRGSQYIHGDIHNLYKPRQVQNVYHMCLWLWIFTIYVFVCQKKEYKSCT